MYVRQKSGILGAAVIYALAVAASNASAAASDEAIQSLDVVTVTATRVAAASYDVPASISSVSGDSLRGGLGVNLSDSIAEVPGLLARNRNNYAQDQQVSIRGFGASSAFGIRGIRVYQDGIPASGPDGQGQVSQFNLDSASRVEILRGPFSSLYGNSSGGVIQLFTEDGKLPNELRAGVAYGNYNTLRANLGGSGAAGPFDYNASFTHFSVEGYRDHSTARSESFNSKLNYTINDANRLTLVLTALSRPDTDDPLGLTDAQFRSDPVQTAAPAIQFDTRKSLQQEQAGLIYDLKLTDAQALRFMGYFGKRSVEQFLSVTVGAQAPATSSGGVVDLDRRYGGGDVRWTWQSQLANRPLSLVVGAAYDKQNEHRRGYNNFVGTVTGVKGLLRRDEDNIVYDFDQYAEGTWEFAEQWSAMVGVRHTDVHFESDDHYIVGTNGDDSGSKSYSDVSPVAGVIYKPLSWLHIYGSYGKGFQTPIGSEVAYQATGGAGLNLSLQPASSNNAEFGVKMHIGSDLGIEAALFEALTNNDIVLNTNNGGRSTYQNADTKRQGAELSVDYRFTDAVRLQLAYTYVDASYDGAYLTCAATPCPAPTVPVADGKELPGVPAKNLYAGVRLGRDTGWNASFSAQALSRVPVADTNAIKAPGYGTADVGAGYIVELSSLRISAFARVNNILDKRYVGSVIVSDGNQRYFEPGPGRNALAGVNIAWK